MLRFPQISFAPEGTSGPGVAGASAETASTSSAAVEGLSSPSGASSDSSSSSPGGDGASSPSRPAEAESSLGDDFFSGMETIEVPEVEAAPPPPEPTTKPPKPEAPKVVSPAQEAPPEQPKETKAEAAPPTAEGQTALPPPSEPGQLAEMLAANEASLVDALAKNDFALTKEDIELLETDASAAVPRLLARTYVRAQHNMLQMLQRCVPEMMQKELSRVTAANELMGRFFSKWPQIDRTKHMNVVREMGKLYRQLNPAATPEKMMDDLGPLVMMKAGIPLTQGAPQTPVAGHPMGNGTRPPQPTPFKPALGGPASIATQPVTNPWDGLYENE